MPRSKARFIAMLVLIACCSPLACAAEEQDGEVVVTAQKKSGEVLIDAYFSVPATQRETWAVLTDFAHMAQFVSNLQVSEVIEKSGDRMKILQKGKTAHGLLSFSFESIREVEMRPYEYIHSHTISGTMKKSEGTTRLVAEGNDTRVTYHSESISGVWIPPLIGTTFIENEVRSQFQDMRKEILRRKDPP